ncbi:hypothetical protein [Sphingomonas jeddahensis]|uniref:Uncharacterized protein n=1 Tax=Sphingomonas jeddahensis TaxID=1915074 RepID=A0A1V2EUR4_9SPHN|nr:hypothetical protein [Sphingomonas jeddahensis]ONF96412.1 hypothetical protein SPHI_11970 [Sphingomonas jeddahensis]
MTGVDLASPSWVGWWFRGAAIYGLIALLPQYLFPQPAGAELASYAFIGTASAFQLVFWAIGGDPMRYRALMLAGVAEKLAFGVPAVVLFARGFAPAPVLVFGGIDLALGLGFMLAWRATAPAA